MTKTLRTRAIECGKVLLRASPVLVAGALAASPAYAGGLSQLNTVGNDVLSDIKLFVPIVATGGLILAGMAFAFQWVQMKYIFTFAIGCLIMGAAGIFVPTLLAGMT